jgi:hypothetical protein
LFIGLVLILNALALQGKILTREVGIFNLFAGALTLVAALYLGTVPAQLPLSAALLLFAITYLWFGLNTLKQTEDQQALGYFSLLSAVLALPYAAQAYFREGDLGWSVVWVSFGLLWLLTYLRSVGNTRLRGLTIVTNYLTGLEVLALAWLHLNGSAPLLTRVG